PGNSVVVGRRTAFGGAFGPLRSLKQGDQVVVSTTQGQSVYEVTSTAPAPAGGPRLDEPYGPTASSQLTLVTSASALPWRNDRALVVVAALRTPPFQPTAQGSRGAVAPGAAGEEGARASVALALLAYGVVLGGAVVLYRRLPARTAYLASAPTMLALTLVAAETLSRILPAWL
ncbi:MAG: sortase domain-containing protein, partial [Acidimicrobiales bacterium]